MATQDIVNNQRIAKAVNKFSLYSDEILSFVNNIDSNSALSVESEAINGILNGRTTLALDRLVPLAVRKEAGIFFTSTTLSDKVAEQLTPLLHKGVKVCDPANGAGNLLIACSKHLPIGTNLNETLQLWSGWLAGYDLFSEFVHTAKLRLLLSAAQRHGERINLNDINLDKIFPGLKQGDAFSFKALTKSKCLVLNPPYGHILAPADCQWAKGKIQTAAWFLENTLKNLPRGRHVVAILPDVLNSGYRYNKWRQIIASRSSYLTIEPAGEFDANTDVDVFMLHLITGKSRSPLSWPCNVTGYNNLKTVSDYFNIHVGAVVPHRDIEEGQQYPYIHARTAFDGQTINQIKETIRSKRTVFAPPFVVIHRTSSPSDKCRCVAAIINEKSKVAVENHLVVCEPLNKSITACEELLRICRSQQTTDWMNSRIRCRHLTVSSVNEIPWIEV